MIFKRKPSLFREINKRTKAKIKEIEKVADPEARLAQYEALAESFGSSYGAGDVQKSVNRLDSTMTEAVAVGSGASALVAAGVGSIVAASFPPALIGVAALSASVAAGARQLIYRSEARRLHLKAQDVKFAVKTRRLQNKVEKTIKTLSMDLEKQKSLENLQKSFNDEADLGKESVRIRKPVPADRNLILRHNGPNV